MKDLSSLLTHDEFTKHIAFTSSAPVALRSAITQIILIYVRGNVDCSVKEGLSATLEATLSTTFAEHAGVTATSYGWSVENDVPIRGEKGQAGFVFAAAIGWSGPELQRSFQETGIWKVAEDKVSDLEGVLKVTSITLSCQCSERVSK